MAKKSNKERLLELEIERLKAEKELNEGKNKKFLVIAGIIGAIATLIKAISELIQAFN